ncbi:hypothetical protein NSTCB13_02344 [Nostoc sp. DSM 114160]
MNACVKGLPTKKISYRGVGRGAGGRGQGEKEKYDLSKLDNLFSGSPQEEGCREKDVGIALAIYLLLNDISRNFSFPSDRSNITHPSYLYQDNS